ncbi:MAG: S8 family serine peptidase [Lysobacterales bacterium]
MMGNRFQVKALTAAVAVALAGVMSAPAGFAAAAPSAQQAQARETYMIRFAEAGIVNYKGGAGALLATAPSATGSSRLNLKSPAATAYHDFLKSTQQQHLAAIAAAIGRPLVPSHYYLITESGVAAELTAAEAADVAAVPGVARVEKEKVYPLATYHGPEFIGAPSIWDGTGTPTGVGTLGQGVVVGDIDTGIEPTHPSFADDPVCGFGPENHKLLSAVDCSSTDANGLCNGPDPVAADGNGHGVHTASTAAGDTIDGTVDPPPTIPPPFTTMSGVAPCASLRTYKACPTNQCPGADILGGINTAIADGVDTLNFSISGGTDPWNDNDRNFLDAMNAGIFVAAAAGNTGSGVTDPVGEVNHRGPWLLSVAAVTHDLNISGTGLLSATGPGTPPGDTQNISLTPGSGLDAGQPLTGAEIRYDADNPIGCTANGGFPPDFFDGAVALISRGTCTFEEKIDNAQQAGAILALIYNNTTGVLNMAVGGATLPAYSMLQTDGNALVTFITANGTTATTVDFTPAVQQGDVLAGFSLRGPDPLASVTKPDVAAPGVSIYAAVTPSENNYAYYSGTSMATPHVTGSGTLIRAVHPDWTVEEVNSALMLTAFTGGTEEDGTTPWTPDDVGSGRVDLTKAALAGFVLDETYDNFVAADPNAGGDPATLNIASMRNVACSGSCQWTRTLTNTLQNGGNWTVTVNQQPGVTVTVDPESFTFGPSETIFLDGFDGNDEVPPNQTQALTVTATPTEAMGNITFVEIVFHEANGAAPDAHMYVAVQGSP